MKMGKLIIVFVPVREQQLESKANFVGKMASRGPVDGRVLLAQVR